MTASQSWSRRRAPLAKDAAELVEVDYEPLPAAVDVEARGAGRALRSSTTSSARTSVYVWKLEAGEVDDGIRECRGDRQGALLPSAPDPERDRAAKHRSSQPNPATGDVTMWSATQIPHILRLLAAATIGMPESKLRVVAPDVGGGFGSKLDVYAEELLALALARRLAGR